MPGLPISITPETVRLIATALSMAPEAIGEIRGFVERFVPDQGQRLDAATEIQRIVARARGDAVQTTVEAAPAPMQPQAPAADPVPAKAKGWIASAGAIERYLAFGLVYVVIGQPLLKWAVEIARVATNANLPPIPELTIAQVVAAVGGLGVAGSLRLADRSKGAAV